MQSQLRRVRTIVPLRPYFDKESVRSIRSSPSECLLYTGGVPPSSSARRFIPGMVDSLNAEISLGTVSNVKEASQWIGYTYLFVRMRRNPMNYGERILNLV